MRSFTVPKDDTRKYLLASEVRSILVVSSDIVWRLARTGAVRTIPGRGKFNKPCYLFDAEDVEKIRASANEPRDKWITRHRAAEILGVHVNSLTRMTRFQKIAHKTVFNIGVHGHQYENMYVEQEVRDLVKFASDIPRVTDSIGGYISGLIDGEGSFGITARTTRKTGTSYEASLKITLRDDDLGVLIWTRDILGCGRIHLIKQSSPRKPTANLDISDHAGISRIIRLLEKYPLHAKKQRDFEIVKEFVSERNRPDRNKERLVELSNKIKQVREYIPPSQELIDQALVGNQALDKKRIRGLGLTHK